ncbi:MAG: type III PLP-dependent enzyme [Beijerinckiaceae bacterium]|nr:type III PLP-dependent enzyme [Beijerinckiaceae bacterium]
MSDLPLTVPPLAAALIAENFRAGTHGLEIGGLPVRTLVARHGSPLYLYDAGLLRRRYRALAATLEGFASVYFSIKANPNPGIARVLVEEGAGLEIASGAEFLLARQAGCAPEHVLFAGPGKGREEIDLVLAAGIGEVHLEGFDDIALVGARAAALGRIQPVSLRINPGAQAQGGAMRMGGKPSAFGIDEEQMAEAVAALKQQPALKLTGIHLFAGTQILDAGILLDQWRYGLELASRLAGLAGHALTSIDLGGGLGIPYHAGDATLDLAAIRSGLPALRAVLEADPRLREARLLVEPGRWLAGPAGLYVGALRAVKQSRGQRFLISDGGMHHHLAASGNLGQVIKRDYPIVAPDRLTAPLLADTQLVGPLCTPLDTLGRQTALPELAAGDLVAILQSGAYGLSASPVGFLSHPMPAEVLVENGKAEVIRPAGTFQAPLVNARGEESFWAAAAE